MTVVRGLVTNGGRGEALHGESPFINYILCNFEEPYIEPLRVPFGSTNQVKRKQSNCQVIIQKSKL